MPLEILGDSLEGICCKVIAWILPWQLCNPLIEPAVFISFPVIYCEDNSWNELVMCIVKSSACNTLRHWFMPIYSPLLFSCIVSFVQNTWPAFGFWGGAVMQVSGGCCKIARASVIVMEGCTKRMPSESSSIAEPCLSKLTIIKTVFDTSKNCISRASNEHAWSSRGPWAIFLGPSSHVS